MVITLQHLFEIKPTQDLIWLWVGLGFGWGLLDVDDIWLLDHILNLGDWLWYDQVLTLRFNLN